MKEGHIMCQAGINNSFWEIVIMVVAKAYRLFKCTRDPFFKLQIKNEGGMGYPWILIN